jgi:hypothetical protein
MTVGLYGVHRSKGLALATLMIASLAVSACGRDENRQRETRAGTWHESASAVPRQSSGEVVVALDKDSAPTRWLGDNNMLALIRLLNARQTAAADWELQHWGSDTTRALAEEMAREHSAMRYAIDSLALTLQLAPILPALGHEIDSVTQRQLETLQVPGGRPLDRAYVNEQIASHELMLDYTAKFAAAAEHAQLRALLDTISGRLKAHLARGRTLKKQFAQADSAKAAADSARRARLRRP